MDKNIVNEIATHPLQTFEWGEFRREWGNEVVMEKFGLVTLHKLPLSQYNVGMLIRGKKPTEADLSQLREFAKEKGIIFIKLEPNVLKEEATIKLLKSAGAIEGKTLFTPSSFWIDLTKTEEELLSSFHPKTRYNIRYAEKNGVAVSEDNSPEAFEKYIELMRETVQRQSFFAHNEDYHRLMWKHLHTKPKEAGQKPIAHLLTAKYQGEVVTAWIVFAWKDFLFYPYGASTDRHKNVQANSAIMWGAIKFGKELGLTTFDLWGREEGKGFTKFKEGFSPKVVEFLGTWDLVINKSFYNLNRFAEKVRWPLLRLKTRFSKPTF